MKIKKYNNSIKLIIYEKIFVKKYKSYNMFYMLNKIYIYFKIKGCFIGIKYIGVI